jgi:ATP-binding cassette subfamily B protein
MVNLIQRGLVSLGRVNEVMKTKPSIRSPEFAKTPEPALSKGEKPLPVIELRNLSFSYPDGPPVLENIDLTIEEGSMVGILGRTGSGKSTLIKTLPRMIDPPEGTVFVKGLEVGGWDLGELRHLFGVTPQDSYLFSDSIKLNIGYGLENPGEDQIARAAALSAIDRDLSGFSQGWDTLIGERGLTLSGGQKQRVSISRALIGEPEFLILDDALSAVDVETEKRILNALVELRRERAAQGRSTTAIVISHRVSTLRNADRVLVLDKGRITEYGTPQELAGRSGYYARIAALQRLEQEGDPSLSEAGGG